jgi:hypothetical protein
MDKVEQGKGPSKKEEKVEKLKKGLHGNYFEYTSLNTSREQILQECANIKFVKAKVRFDRELKESSRTDI